METLRKSVLKMQQCKASEQSKQTRSVRTRPRSDSFFQGSNPFAVPLALRKHIEDIQQEIAQVTGCAPLQKTPRSEWKLGKLATANNNVQHCRHSCRKMSLESTAHSLLGIHRPRSYMRRYDATNTVLGEGSFGAVLTGFDRLTNTEVAIKVVQKQKLSSIGAELAAGEFELMRDLREHQMACRKFDPTEPRFAAQPYHRRRSASISDKVIKKLVSLSRSSNSENTVKVRDRAATVADNGLVARQLSSTSSKLYDTLEQQREDSERVVQVYDRYEDGLRYVMVFERINGRDLIDVLDEFPDGLCEDSAAHVFLDICKGLRWMHQTCGIAHLDVKLENVMFDDATHISKLIDFGFSHRCLKPDGSFKPLRCDCGTLVYLAPEAMREERAYDGRQADVYSLGVLLFALLLGKFPFSGRSTASLLPKKQRLRFDQPDWWVDVSMPAMDLLQKMLRPNPKVRITLDEIFEHAWLKVNSKQ